MDNSKPLFSKRRAICEKFGIDEHVAYDVTVRANSLAELVCALETLAGAVRVALDNEDQGRIGGDTESVSVTTEPDGRGGFRLSPAALYPDAPKSVRERPRSP